MFTFNIQQFADVPGTTAPPVTLTVQNTNQASLSPTMKTYYDTELLENVKEQLYFNQFGKAVPLPANRGKKIEFRKMNTFERVTEPLTEGVTPEGHGVGMESITSEVSQFGDFVAVSDILDMTAVDDIILEITDESSAQAAASLDGLTRHKIMKGSNVMWAPKVAANGDITKVLARSEIDASCKLTSTVVNKAVTKLKKSKAPKIDGKYIAIIHPSCSEDLRESEGWLEAHKYSAATEIFNGEIGELHGVRFIESNEIPVVAGGADGAKVYCNFFFGRDAYARVDLEGGALEMIIKGYGSGGTADPLDQRQTVGWKACHGACILYDERLLRVECGSSYSDTDETNYDASKYANVPG